VLENWGLQYEVLAELNPRLIYVTMPTMGAGGPRSFYGGVSWGIQAMAGLNLMSGYPDRIPISPSPYSHPDVSCNPLHAAFAILSALHHRRKTGRGQLIELSQYESTVSWLGLGVLAYSANGTGLPRSANDHPRAAPHDVYRTEGEDRWCAIAVYSDAQWATLCEVIGRPELATHRAYATVAARRARPEQLREVIEAWTASRSAEEVMRTLQERRVPASVVNGFHELMRTDPQLQHRQTWVEREHPELPSVAVEDWAFKLSATPRVERRRAPLLGEHNEHVFQKVLQMSEDEMDTLLVEGVLR
jgi:benzylsuccinate CoA-transferase BbsF subunit